MKVSGSLMLLCPGWAQWSFPGTVQALPAEMLQPRAEPGGLEAAIPLFGCTQWVPMGSNRAAVIWGFFFAFSRKLLLKSIIAQLWSYLPQDSLVHEQISFTTPPAGSGSVCWDRQRDPGVPGHGGHSCRSAPVHPALQRTCGDSPAWRLAWCWSQGSWGILQQSRAGERGLQTGILCNLSLIEGD